MHPMVLFFWTVSASVKKGGLNRGWDGENIIKRGTEELSKPCRTLENEGEGVCERESRWENI